MATPHIAVDKTHAAGIQGVDRSIIARYHFFDYSADS